MVWVGLGLAPGNNHSKGSTDDLNRTGASLGVMAQANADQGNEGIGASEFRTAQALGKRVAEAALRWQKRRRSRRRRKPIVVIAEAGRAPLKVADAPILATLETVGPRVTAVVTSC